MKVRYTVPSDASRISYVGNGSTQVFPIPFVFFDDTDIQVTLVNSTTAAETPQVLTTNFTVSGGEGETGSVTMLVAPTAGYNLVIVREIPYTQEIDYQANDGFPADVNEEGLDRSTMLAQQVRRRAQQSPKLPETFDPDSDDPISIPLPEAGKVLVGNTNEDGFENVAAGEIPIATAPTAIVNPANGDSLFYSDGFWRNYSSFIDLRSTGAGCNGTTDDSTKLNTLITSLSAAGGGTIVIPRTTAVASTIVLKRNVSLIFLGGAKLLWTGVVSGTCVETDPADVVQNAAWLGLTIDSGAAFTGTALSIHSAHNIYADKITLITTGTTSTAAKMYANSSGGESALTKRNITQCVFGAITQQGQCGTFVETGGVNVASGYDGNAQVVTLNTFGGLFAQNCSVYGLNIKQWFDNNSFSGMIRVGLNGNGAVGLQVGGPSAADNLGVYMNKFNLLAVDTFGVLTGRIGINLERSKLTVVDAYYQNPAAEGGQLVAAATAESYDIKYHDDATKKTIRYVRKADDHVDGPVGFTSSALMTLADDTATSIVVDDPSNSNQNIHFLAVITSSDANSSGVVWCKSRKSAGSPAASLIAGGSAFNVVTGGGPLTGTTSTDNRLSVSPGADGKLYIENRLGVSVSIRFTSLGRDQSLA